MKDIEERQQLLLITIYIYEVGHARMKLEGGGSLMAITHLTVTSKSVGSNLVTIWTGEKSIFLIFVPVFQEA